MSKKIKDVDKYLSTLKELSDTGDRDAKHKYGVLLYEGEIVPQNKPEAAKLFKEIADSVKPHNPIYMKNSVIPLTYDNQYDASKSQYMLAQMLLNGDGIPMDKESSEHYAVAAAKRNHPDAIKMVGDLRAKGFSAIDKEEAEAAYITAINKGSMKGYEGLGDMYNRNSFFYFRESKAHEKAFGYYNEGSINGDGACSRKMAYMLMNGRGVDQDIPRAIKLYEKAVSQGDKLSAEILGDMHLHGNNVPESAEMAAKWYSQSDAPTALTKLASIHYGNQNKPEAAKCFEKAGNNGQVESKFAFAVMMDKGDGIEMNKKQAAIEYKELADDGHISSQYNLAILKLKGQGVETNKSEAANLFQTASSAGHMKARYKLGVMLINGDGIKKDKDNGFLLIQSSAESGYGKAKEFMQSKKAKTIDKDSGKSAGMGY